MAVERCAIEDRLAPLIEQGWEQLARSRETADRSRAVIASIRRKRLIERRREPIVHLAADRPAATPSDPAPNGRLEIDAWRELGDGSPEQDAAIEQAVLEIVELQYLFVEALCRHFPALAPTIREVAVHLFENAENLKDPECCGGVSGALGTQLGRLN